MSLRGSPPRAGNHVTDRRRRRSWFARKRSTVRPGRMQAPSRRRFPAQARLPAARGPAGHVEDLDPPLSASGARAASAIDAPSGDHEGSTPSREEQSASFRTGPPIAGTAGKLALTLHDARKREELSVGRPGGIAVRSGRFGQAKRRRRVDQLHPDTRPLSPAFPGEGDTRPVGRERRAHLVARKVVTRNDAHRLRGRRTANERAERRPAARGRLPPPSPRRWISIAESRPRLASSKPAVPQGWRAAEARPGAGSPSCGSFR